MERLTARGGLDLPAPDSPELERELDRYRKELVAYAYRMLGSSFEAEDAVQETLIRAWRNYSAFEGRSALKSWLYRIATNVCLDMLGGAQRRARPMDLGPAQAADERLLGAPLPEVTWLEPIPDARVLPSNGDPAEIAEIRDSVRLAFVAALQQLPPKQRSVLILREVLRWKADEVADLLDTSVASVNSALQRARAAISEAAVEEHRETGLDEEHEALLKRYVDAFERYDMDDLTALLREDASWSMPPFSLWLRGHDDIRTWMLGAGIGCMGSRLLATSANGAPAFAHYKPEPDGTYAAWALQVLDISGDEIAGVCFFLDAARLFPEFGFPLRLES